MKEMFSVFKRKIKKECKVFARETEAVVDPVTLAQSETMRSDDLDTTPTSSGKMI